MVPLHMKTAEANPSCTRIAETQFQEGATCGDILLAKKTVGLASPIIKGFKPILLKSLIKNNICRKHLLVRLYGSGNPTNPCTKKSELQQLKYTLFLV